MPSLYILNDLKRGRKTCKVLIRIKVEKRLPLDRYLTYEGEI
jgi:hypothetical protein